MILSNSFTLLLNSMFHIYNPVIEQYCSYVYSKPIDDMAEFRFQTFVSYTNNSFRKLPSSKEAPELRIRGVLISQAGSVRGSTGTDFLAGPGSGQKCRDRD